MTRVLVDGGAVRLALVAAFVACVAGAAGARAQREYVEEIEPPPTNIDDADLDAPDPAAKKPKRPIPDAGIGPTPTPTPAPATLPTASTPPSAPAAATAPADARPSQPPAVAPPVADASAAIHVLETTYAALLEKWDARALAVRKGEAARAKKMLPEVDAALLDFGVQGVPGGFRAPAVATALLLEARRAVDDGSVEDAQALVDAAERAAPDLAAVHTTHSWLAWARGDVGAAVNALADAVKAATRDPLVMSQLGARALVVVGLVLMTLLGLCALLLGLRALRYLSFDLLQLLPRGAHAGQMLALVVMGALVPLAVGAGPVFGALWILTLAWLYLDGAERIVVAALAIACLAVPLGVDPAARMLAYPDSRAHRAHRALLEAEAEPLRVALAAAPASSLNVFERAALAGAAKREGRLADAFARWQALAAAEPERAFVHGGFGVAAALQNNEDLALTELGKAASGDMDGVAAAAAFDASVLHYRNGRTDKAEAAVAPATSAAPDLLHAFRRTTYRAPEQRVNHNRAFIDVYPSPHEMLEAGLAPSLESAAVADAMSRWILRGERGTRGLAYVGIFPLLWLVGFLLRDKLGPCRPCARCGQPASRRVDGKDVPPDTCSQCFHAFVSTRSRIDAADKLRKEREIMRRHARMGRTIVALGVVFPGAGHLYGGAPGRGFVFALLHTLGLAALAIALGVWPDARLTGPWPDTIALVAVGVGLGIVWLVSLRSTWSLAQDASGRGRR